MTQDPPPETQAPAKIDIIGFLARFAPLIFLIVLMAGFALYEPRFLTPLNLFNVLRQVSIYGLLAVGMTFVILTSRLAPWSHLPASSRLRSRRAASPIALRSALARKRRVTAGTWLLWLRSLSG
jgi:hypothetical protein